MCKKYATATKVSLYLFIFRQSFLHIGENLKKQRFPGIGQHTETDSRQLSAVRIFSYLYGFSINCMVTHTTVQF
jgi:hypothetical protein